MLVALLTQHLGYQLDSRITKSKQGFKRENLDFTVRDRNLILSLPRDPDSLPPDCNNEGLINMRIDKMLARMGFGTRSEVRRLLADGRVSLSEFGTIIDPSYHVPDNVGIILDGKLYKYEEFHYAMLNKPPNYITATTDPRSQTVMDLLPPMFNACGAAPVGRLDKDVTGLLIITNDGQLAHRLISPRHGVPKEYIADVSGALNGDDVEAFKEGLHLDDFTALPAELSILSASGGESTARLIINEGKFHQVKRMFAARGKPVLRLKRLSIGGVTLDPSLAEGEWRTLTPDELNQLKSY